MPALTTAIEEAAQLLARGRGEALLAEARTALSDMNWAVRTILGDSTEVLRRASKSTGTERLSFVIGKADIKPIVQRAMVTEKEANATKAVYDKAKEVLEHLTARGVNAETANLATSQPGVVRHAVDVILDDKVLGYTIGEKTTAALKGSVGLPPL